MVEAVRDGVLILIGFCAVILLSRIYDVLSQIDRIDQRIVVQAEGSRSVRVDQDHPLTVSVDNDVLNVRVQK